MDPNTVKPSPAAPADRNAEEMRMAYLNSDDYGAREARNFSQAQLNIHRGTVAITRSMVANAREQALPSGLPFDIGGQHVFGPGHVFELLDAPHFDVILQLADRVTANYCFWYNMTFAEFQQLTTTTDDPDDYIEIACPLSDLSNMDAYGFPGAKAGPVTLEQEQDDWLAELGREQDITTAANGGLQARKDSAGPGEVEADEGIDKAKEIGEDKQKNDDKEEDVAYSGPYLTATEIEQWCGEKRAWSFADIKKLYFSFPRVGLRWGVFGSGTKVFCGDPELRPTHDAGFNQSKNTFCLQNGVHYAVAMLGSAAKSRVVKDGDEACDLCRNSKRGRKYTKCITVPGQFGGSCTNCVTQAHGKDCSLHE